MTNSPPRFSRIAHEDPPRSFAMIDHQAMSRRRTRGRITLVAASALLVVHAGLLAWSAIVHSPNVNEPSHLAAGLCHWQLGRFDLYRVNPPLVRLVAALPVLAAGVETDWSNLNGSARVRSEFRVGQDWVAANGERSLWLTTLARWACIPFSILGGIVCFMWARDLYGPPAALLSCALWCFSPNILGHASCFTPDAHATAVGLAANYLFWTWLQRPSWPRAGGAGVLLGLTLLTKTTWIVLLLLWPLMWGIWLALTWRGPLEYRRSASMARWGWGQFGLIWVLGLHILNLGYLYDGTFRQLGEFTFISRALSGKTDGGEGNQFRGTRLASIPIPLPVPYVVGLDVQKQDHERHPVSFFRGKMYHHGFWYFYLYALAIKVPLGTWMLAAGAAVFKLMRRERNCSRRDEFVLLAPSCVILTLASSETDYTAHFRYILPILPYLLIWTGQVGLAVSRRSFWTPLVVAALAWSVGSTLWISPHWLSYFNEFAGGPSGGYRHLANSNLDWGQDLLYLRKWLVEHPEVEPIGLAYYGMFHPREIGVSFRDVPEWDVGTEETDMALPGTTPSLTGPRPGWYAVSVNFIVGHPFWIYRADGSRIWRENAGFRWFDHLKPVGRAGYSILIYHVTEDDCLHLRSRLLVETDPLRDD